jgi:hypothetical protein
MPDRLLIGRLEVVDVQHLTRAPAVSQSRVDRIQAASGNGYRVCGYDEVRLCGSNIARARDRGAVA